MHTVPIAIDVSACTDFKHCHCTSMGVLIYLVLGVAFVLEVLMNGCFTICTCIHLVWPLDPTSYCVGDLGGGGKLDLATIVNFTPRLNQ